MKDNQNKPIKVNDKFKRSEIEDISIEDVNYINKRLGFYPDTKSKREELKQ